MCREDTTEKDYRSYFFEQWSWFSDIYTVKIDGRVKTTIVSDIFPENDQEIEDLIETAKNLVKDDLEGPYLQFFSEQSRSVEFISTVNVMG